MDDEVIFEKYKNINLNYSKKQISAVIIVILVLIFVLPFFFTVDPEEMAVVQLFGKHVRTVEPGLNVRIPWGVEKVTKVKVKTVFKEEFGFRTLTPGVSARYAARSFD